MASCIPFTRLSTFIRAIGCLIRGEVELIYYHDIEYQWFIMHVRLLCGVVHLSSALDPVADS